MRCKICNKECVNKEMNICSECSTSGIEYKIMKKVYLENGKEVEILTSFQDDGINKYVVKIVLGKNYYENGYEEITELKIVNRIYEKLEDCPLYNKKTELEKEIDELRTEIENLSNKKKSLTNKLKDVFCPIIRIKRNKQ